MDQATEDRIWDDGFDAYPNGVCPHPPCTIKWQLWHAGFKKAGEVKFKSDMGLD